MARKLTPYPLPSGRADGWSCLQSSVGRPRRDGRGHGAAWRPSGGHGGRSHRRKGSTFHHPRFTSPRPEVTPSHLILGLGVPCGGVHIRAPSWSGGGEGRRPSCQPPGDTRPRVSHRCASGAVPFMPRPGPRCHLRQLPQTPCTQCFHAGRAQGKHGRLGSTLRTQRLTLEGKRERFLSQLERPLQWGFCGRSPPGVMAAGGPWGRRLGRCGDGDGSAPILSLSGPSLPTPLGPGGSDLSLSSLQGWGPCWLSPERALGLPDSVPLHHSEPGSWAAGVGTQGGSGRDRHSWHGRGCTETRASCPRWGPAARGPAWGGGDARGRTGSRD